MYVLYVHGMRVKVKDAMRECRSDWPAFLRAMHYLLPGRDPYQVKLLALAIELSLRDRFSLLSTWTAPQTSAPAKARTAL